MDLYNASILALGLIALLIFMITSSRSWYLQRDELMLRREEFQRGQVRAQREQAEQDYRERLQSSLLADRLADIDEPVLAGDYFTFVFDLGPDIQRAAFVKAVGNAISLPEELAELTEARPDVQVNVHRASYRNPFVIVLIVSASTTVIGGIALSARRINRAIQDIRREWAETRDTNAEHDRNARNYELEERIAQELLDAMDEDDATERNKRLAKAQRVADTAARTGLLSVSHRTVTELEAAQNRENPTLPRRSRLLAIEGGSDDEN